MSRLRVAVVGVGHLGQHHARVLAAHPDVELVAVADTRLDQAEAVAARNGTTAVADFRGLALIGSMPSRSPSRRPTTWSRSKLFLDAAGSRR